MVTRTISFGSFVEVERSSPIFTCTVLISVACWQFAPEPGFAELAPLFQREVELVDSAGDLDVDAWEAVQAEIRRTVALVKPDGQEAADFILHIRGSEASFRWSDEPRDE
jgi:hypothetical protein